MGEGGGEYFFIKCIINGTSRNSTHGRGVVLARKINMLFLYKLVYRIKVGYLGNGQLYTKCEYNSGIHDK